MRAARGSQWTRPKQRGCGDRPSIPSGSAKALIAPVEAALAPWPARAASLQPSDNVLQNMFNVRLKWRRILVKS
jgi:hypothetical protein